MAAPANLTYTNIETRVMNQLRIPTTNTTEQTKIQALINEIYRDIYQMHDWWFLVKRQILNTVAKYTTGTANVTNLSTAVTLSNAPAAGLGSFVGYVFYVLGDTQDNNAVYRISTHAAGSANITLDANFTGVTNTAATFRIYQDTLPLAADTGKIFKVKRWGLPFPLARVTPEEMADTKTSDTREGHPEIYTLEDFATTGDPTTQRSLLLHPFPDKTYRLEILYKQQLNTELSSTTQPFLPDEYRQILVYGSLARGYPIFLDDVIRGQFFQNLYDQQLTRMTSAHLEQTHAKPQFAPMDSDRRRWAPRRRGHVTLGNLFDVWPNEP